MLRSGFLAFVVVCLNLTTNCSAGIVLFNFNGGSAAPVSNPISGIVFGNMSAANTVGGGPPTGGAINSTSPSGSYAGASGTFNIGNAVNNAAFSANTSPYFSVTVSNSTGDQLVLNDFDFGMRSTATGATSVALRSSFDGFASDLVLVNNTVNSIWTFKNQTFAPILLGSGVSLDFRIYTYGGGATATNNAINTRLDDIQFDINSITAIPEPGSVCLIGAVALALGSVSWFRRKRRLS